MCPVCSARAGEVGVLCEECRDELSSPIKITPEQIQAPRQRRPTAALIDLWGRPHQLDARTLIGRQVEGQRHRGPRAQRVAQPRASSRSTATRWTIARPRLRERHVHRRPPRRDARSRSQTATASGSATSRSTSSSDVGSCPTPRARAARSPPTIKPPAIGTRAAKPAATASARRCVRRGGAHRRRPARDARSGSTSRPAAAAA